MHPIYEQLSSPLFKTKWRPRMYVTKYNVLIVWHWSCFELRQHFSISRRERPMFCWHEGQGPQQYSDTSISRCLSRYAWEIFWLIGPCRMRGAIRNNSVFHVSYSRLALSLLCFFGDLHQFFPGCKLWRGASLSSMTLATQDLTKLRENKIPAFPCMNRSPAASPLGEAQQWLHFKKWADWKRLLTWNCPRSFRGSETEWQREWRCDAWRICAINLNYLYRENFFPHSKVPGALILMEITSKCKI